MLRSWKRTGMGITGGKSKICGLLIAKAKSRDYLLIPNPGGQLRNEIPNQPKTSPPGSHS